MPRGPLRQALKLAAAFDRHRVPYAIGGALAYGIWGIPRATLDVDVNVFVDEQSLASTLAALRSVGATVDDAQAARDAAQEGMFVARIGPYRLDVFTSSIAFCEEAEKTRVRIQIGRQRAWFLSAEALSVFKLMFFRPKDVIDLERLIAVRGRELDVAYVREKLVEMVGEDDARIVRWDELTKAAH